MDPRAGLDDVEKRIGDNQKVKNLNLYLRESKLTFLSIQI
jgi:hypothetical protein